MRRYVTASPLVLGAEAQCLLSNDKPAGAMLQEMEDMFRRTIPQEARYGSRFVFRQVHPHVVGSRVLTAAE